MGVCMALRHTKYADRLRPAIGGPPSGTSDVVCMMTLAGWSDPVLIRFTRVRSAGRRTPAPCCRASVCPQNLALGCWQGAFCVFFEI